MQALDIASLVLGIVAIVLLFWSFVRFERSLNNQNVLKGLSFSERWRVLKIARSGEVIDDALAARHVRETVLPQVSQPFLGGRLAWIGYAAWFLAAVLRAVSLVASDEMSGGEAALRVLISLAVPVLLMIPAFLLRRSFTKTARANGWT